MPLRILHIGKFYPPFRGGMETFLRDLAREQARRGMAPRVLVHDRERGRPGHCSEEQWAGASFTVRTCSRWGTLAYTPISPGFPAAIIRELQARPDVLHIHMPNPSAFVCLLIPAARRIPWVVHWHADVSFPETSRFARLLYGLYKFPEAMLLRRAARILVTSPPYAEASRPLRQHSQKLDIVPLGIPRLEEREIPPAQAEPAGSGNLRILFIGRLTFYKGIDVAIKALSEYAHGELRIIGEGDERDAWQRGAQEGGVADRIHFLGDCNERILMDELEQCDVLCLPSTNRAEAFGLVILEAMRAGKPCVVTNVPGTGMSWIVQHGKTGLVTQVGDAGDLAGAFRKLGEDREYLHRLGLQARRRFASLFTLDACANLIEAAYAAAGAGTRPADGDINEHD